MRLKFISFFVLSLCSVTASAFTEITIVNNTNAPVTGSMTFTPCSSVIGDNGVIKPHQTFTIPESSISMLCGNSACEGDVYMTNNCSGKKVAHVKASVKEGVISIRNDDKSHYIMSGKGDHVSIDGVG